MRAKERGLTILEVVLAVAIIAIVMGVLTTTVVSNLKQTSTTGASSQAAQVLNYLGRRVAGGQTEVLPPANTTARRWDYGQLTAFTDLATAERGISDPIFYKAQVTNSGQVQLAGSQLTRYTIEVCHERGGGEHCVSGTTFGPSPLNAANPNSVPPLPGLN